MIKRQNSNQETLQSSLALSIPSRTSAIFEPSQSIKKQKIKLTYQSHSLYMNSDIDANPNQESLVLYTAPNKTSRILGFFVHS